MGVNGGKSHIRFRIGEVVEAATTGFTTQCYKLYEAPPLGSLVRSDDASPVYGIVYDVATRSMDPARHPIPRGFTEDTEEEVYLNNPQLNRLLLTEFRSIVVGFQSGDGLRRYLAPLPLRIHSFVYQCDNQELVEFSASLDFMPIILSASISAHDDVIASFLRQASEAHPDKQKFMLEAGRGLAVYFSDQLQRLNNLLRRLSS